ncbi:MAG: hypothetical protein RSA17_05920 [Ruthenibacterium sp.]
MRKSKPVPADAPENALTETQLLTPDAAEVTDERAAPESADSNGNFAQPHTASAPPAAYSYHGSATAAAVVPPVRRVGTVTMGVALILSGVLLCVSLFWPTVNVFGLFRFAPLLLALLGVEVLVAYARAKNAAIKYDVLSMILCALLILFSLGVTSVVVAEMYYGGAVYF